MADKLNGRHMIGLYRYIVGLPKASKQIKALKDFGVDMKYCARDLNADDALEKIDKDCRPPGPDVLPCALVTPFLGVLGTFDHSEILAVAGRVGGVLYDIETNRVFTLSEADERHEIIMACRKAQTAPGRHAAKGKGGPKKRYGAMDMIAIQRDYESLDGKIKDICKEWDVSSQWLFNQFGGRTEAQRKAHSK